jgi:hypothetical protein
MPMDERLGPHSSTSVNISVRYEERVLMMAKKFASDGQQDSPVAAMARTPVARRGTEKRLSRAK